MNTSEEGKAVLISLRQYIQSKNKALQSIEVNSLGRKATKLSKERGYEIRIHVNATTRYSHNLYHPDILQEALGF